MKCNYGCGQEAKFKMTSGKFCCCDNYRKCTENRKKYGSIGEKNPMYGKISANRYSLDDWRENYYKLFNRGELQIKDSLLYARCFNCNNLFIPTYEQIRSRENASREDKNKSLLFCSDSCKQTSEYFRRRCEPEILKKYKKYIREVRLISERNIKKYGRFIPDIELRGKNLGYQVDHRYSMRDGFDNNIDSKIIGHWKNLEMLTFIENDKKKRNSSITLVNLLKEIEGAENATI